MKKFVSLLLAAVLLFSFCCAGCSSSSSSSTTRVVNVYNWGEYIDESIFDTFTAQTGIEVNYNTYASNEMLYSNLKSGAATYDVIIPSDYMLARLIEEDMVEPLNFDNIPNISLIDPAYLNLAFDPECTYSVPYTWGTTCIIYNTTKVSEPLTSWNDLFNPEYAGQVLMFDNSRDCIGIALKALGYSFNTTDPAQIAEAVDLLIKQKESGITQGYVMDQIFEKLISGEAAIGPYYVGDYFTMVEENPDLACVVPKEGANLFVDYMCVPKGAQNKEEAELFINFMCETDITLANCAVTGYSTPSLAALDAMDPEIRNNELAYPSAETLARCEVFDNLPADIRALYDSEWIRLSLAQAG